MPEKHARGTAGRVAEGAQSFSRRLATHLRLKADEERTFSLESSNGRITVTLGKVMTPKDALSAHLSPGVRPIHVEGILSWRGMEYEIAIEDLAGKGKLTLADDAMVFDRVAGRLLDGEISYKVYETLVPLIELHVQDIMDRARRRKH